MMGGLSSSIRYIGLANKLMDITVAVRVERNERAKAGIATVVSCPWDNKDMKVVPKSGFGTGKDERTYRCGRKHRIILLSSANGELRGWM